MAAIVDESKKYMTDLFDHLSSSPKIIEAKIEIGPIHHVRAFTIKLPKSYQEISCATLPLIKPNFAFYEFMLISGEGPMKVERMNFRSIEEVEAQLLAFVS